MSRPAGRDPAETIGSGPACTTCADAAERMRVIACEENAELALCIDTAGRRVQVDLGILGPALPGEVLLVHAGTALVRVPA